MLKCGSLLKIALLAMVLVTLIVSGSAAEKLASCCKTVTRQEITDPITGYMVQKANLPCVRAVIFQTEKGLFCSQVNAPWVHRKIVAFEKAKAQARLSSALPSSTASLLSIITSTASTTSSSSPAPSSSSPPPPSSSSLPPSSSPVPSSSSPPPSSSSPPPSSSSLPPSSSSLPSFPSTSEMPADETFSENDEE
ncbi:mucin-5AC-like [Chaetodon trifascialis]|uniref:mucin-5AC-like n=1 Tax=Chaetodon trifascialis TaxID=109706 RepID=UPI0039952B9C